MSNNKISRRNFLKMTAAAGAVTTQESQAFFLSSPPTKPTHTVKALIIGSGFGGSVTGLRLAQAGISTLMLERGQWWIPNANYNVYSPNLPADHRSSWFKTLSSPPVKIELPVLPYAGVLDYTDFGSLRTYQGAAVGGGSIVYGGVIARPATNVLQSIFPASFDVAEFEARYYPLAERMLGISQIPDTILNSSYFRYARVFKEHGERAGYNIKKVNSVYDFNIIQKELDGTVKKSALIGETIYGNNNGCKKSLVDTYLLPAMATGHLSIADLTIVESIAQTATGYEVSIKKITPWGKTEYYQTIRCTYLFMAAGTVGPNTLLLKAKAQGKLPNLNQFAGTQFGTNGNVTWARTVPEALGPIQAAPLCQTIEDLNNPYGTLVAECAYFPTGIDTRSIVQLGVFFDKNRPGPGTMSYSTTRQRLEINWPSDATTKAVQAHRYLVDRLNAVNGGFGGVPLIIPAPSSSRSPHPLGGMPLGKATDDYGRLRGQRGLYVMDGCLIPGSCMVNPSLTITALAERNIARIIAEDFA